MRKIKFRGKDTENGEFIYGDLRQRLGYYPAIITMFPTSEGKVGYAERAVYEKTVGQFTGLHDKKGKEIYEGDILYVEFADKSGGHNLVGWDEKNLSFGVMDAYSYQSISEGYDFAEFKSYVLRAYLKDALICNVVGNVYDNPELIMKEE